MTEVIATETGWEGRLATHFRGKIFARRGRLSKAADGFRENERVELRRLKYKKPQAA